MINKHLMRGIGLGMVTGAAVGLALSPKPKNVKAAAGKAAKAVGNVVGSITENLGM